MCKPKHVCLLQAVDFDKLCQQRLEAKLKAFDTYQQWVNFKKTCSARVVPSFKQDVQKFLDAFEQGRPKSLQTRECISVLVLEPLHQQGIVSKGILTSCSMLLPDFQLSSASDRNQMVLTIDICCFQTFSWLRQVHLTKTKWC